MTEASVSAAALQIELSWPAPSLSPNARVHHMALYRAKKAAKEEAIWATRVAKPLNWKHDGSKLSFTITAHPPKGKVAPDDDNLTSSMKAARDGIALALGVDDRDFAQQPVIWADRTDRGKVLVSLACA